MLMVFVFEDEVIKSCYKTSSKCYGTFDKHHRQIILPIEKALQMNTSECSNFLILNIVLSMVEWEELYLKCSSRIIYIQIVT